MTIDIHALLELRILYTKKICYNLGVVIKKKRFLINI